MESRPYSWVALDPECDHPREEKEERRCDVCCNDNEGEFADDAFFDQDLAAANIKKQTSDEIIIIRDSCDIIISSTDTQSLNSYLQSVNTAYIKILYSLIDDEVVAELVAKDLLQLNASKQSNRQKILIENSRNVNVKTEDADAATLSTYATNMLWATISYSLLT
ncbi:spore coat protein [Bacillus nakamurai]|uniref:Spore coat protein n=1 Tax=Bacillus nakamurai TaxID=1793963 RepID=A0A150F934_9BACI|nr:spore coat protein [Bacillus nakamurai]KXZ13533.1 spore coat protein [Bacillus nakamurai]KXZ18929.1 spore coat protein [Bacillus nakamurai]MED1226156.1 spore coat protein [Bacillus nakamurai]